eukprot:TRINITY_DN66191_c0_g1_i1.p1 TRINITY_DN66191_c0_g1~~TRINITY_DN66191_c0_g1_i1.p1  ORF type:complete len:130 (+),score=20.86 TRINITY_DN66191_c0_g1_i1:213-602(+)
MSRGRRFVHLVSTFAALRAASVQIEHIVPGHGASRVAAALGDKRDLHSVEIAAAEAAVGDLARDDFVRLLEALVRHDDEPALLDAVRERLGYRGSSLEAVGPQNLTALARLAGKRLRWSGWQAIRRHGV